MEETEKTLNQLKTLEINDYADATNISVITILVLCVVVYFIVEKNIQLNNSVCLNISNNSRLLIGLFFGLIFSPQFIPKILPHKYKYKFIDTIFWRIYTMLSFILATIYLPIYLSYLILCGENT